MYSLQGIYMSQFCPLRSSQFRLKYSDESLIRKQDPRLIKYASTALQNPRVLFLFAWSDPQLRTAELRMLDFKRKGSTTQRIQIDYPTSHLRSANASD